MFFTDTPVAPVATPAPAVPTQRLRDLLDALLTTGLGSADGVMNELSAVEYALGLPLTVPVEDVEL